MNVEERLILFIIRKIVYPDKSPAFGDFQGALPREKTWDKQVIDWDRVKELMTYHEITTFAYLALKDYFHLLPEALLEYLKNNYYCGLARDQCLWKEFLRILETCKNADVALVPMKGLSLLIDIYENQPVRFMTDIDILAREKDLLEIERLFCNLGYKKELSGLDESYWKKSQCHITFAKKNADRFSALVDMHWSLDFKRRKRNVLPNFWDRLREVNIGVHYVKLLSPEDTFFSLALHQRRFGKTLCLKYACDTALLLNKYAANFNWDYILKESQKYEMCTTVFFMLSQAKFLLDAGIPENVWKGLNVAYWKRKLISHFIEKNTFLAFLSLKSKSLYLKSHFLLYDNLWESIEYILNIPKEQFAKFYELMPYAKKTDFLYKNRLLYMPLKTLFGLFNTLNRC